MEGLGINVPLLIAQVINFLILLGLLYLVAYKPIMKMFDQRSYGTDPQTGLLDYDKVAELAREFKPLVIVAGYSAYPRRVNFAKMREIADEVGAVLMVDMAHFAGLVAGKVFTGDENPLLSSRREGYILVEIEVAEE
mgnify:CR=1 FL=1